MSKRAEIANFFVKLLKLWYTIKTKEKLPFFACLKGVPARVTKAYE